MFGLALLLAAPPAVWPGYGGPSADFRVALPPAAPWTDANVLWRRPLGPGESGVVTDGTRLYTAYSVPDGKDKKQGEEVVTALEPDTGKTLWEHRYATAMRPKQETFRGAPVGPLATPLVRDGRVYAVGFAGRLVCLDAAAGTVLWRHELVDDFGATPVQFGFAASPVGTKDAVIVHAGGTHALVAFDPATGAARWKSAAAPPGYATPVLATLAGEEQVVQLTRDAVIGYAAADGAVRWQYPLPEKGLTNVPTPLPLPGDRLLVSGQGVGGTRLLTVTRDGGRFAAAEAWANKRVQFFYCNWASAGDVVYGYPANAGKQFTALRWRDGEVLWQDPAQTDANVLAAGGELLLLRGDGRLTRATPGDTGLEGATTYRLFDGRCWTPPTVVGDRLYARNGKEVVAFRLGAK